MNTDHIVVLIHLSAGIRFLLTVHCHAALPDLLLYPASGTDLQFAQQFIQPHFASFLFIYCDNYPGSISLLWF